MIRDPRAFAIRESHMAVEKAAKRQGWVLGSYMRGVWQVLAREHPEVSPYKADFPRAAGVIQ